MSRSIPESLPLRATPCCYACGRSGTCATVMDRQMDSCYELCSQCLYTAWPSWEERKSRILDYTDIAYDEMRQMESDDNPISDSD